MWKRYENLYQNALKESKKKRRKGMCAKLDELKGVSAEEILRRSGQQKSVPVDLDYVFEVIGIYKQERDFSDIEEIEQKGKISGLVVLMGDDVKIFYNANDDLQSRRFTAVHEIGHCCLHGDSLRNDYIEFLHKDGFADEHEKEASIFAGRLLVPKKSLKMVYDKLIAPKLIDLANIFQVPEKIMKIRLREEELKV